MNPKSAVGPKPILPHRLFQTLRELLFVHELANMPPQYTYPNFNDTSSGWRRLFPIENRKNSIETITLGLQITFPTWSSHERYLNRAIQIEETMFLFATDSQDYERRIQRGLDAQYSFRADQAARQAGSAQPLSMSDLFPANPEYEEWLGDEEALDVLTCDGPPPSPQVQVCPETGSAQTEEQVRGSLALRRHPDFAADANDERWNTIQDFKNKFVPGFPALFEMLLDMLDLEPLSINPMATTYNLGQCLRLLQLEYPSQISQGLTVKFVKNATRYLPRVISAFSEKLLQVIFHEHPEMTQDQKGFLAEFIEECVRACEAQQSSTTKKN